MEYNGSKSSRVLIRNRSCTDVLCLLLFVVFLIGWAVVGYFGFRLGNPEKLIHPTDSSGRICGHEKSVKDKPFLFFFDLTKCASPFVLTTGCPTPQVCVEKCPEETFVFSSSQRQPKQVNKLICTDNVTVDVSNADRLVSAGHCARWYVTSKPVGGRCLPSIDGEFKSFAADGRGLTSDNDVTKEELNRAMSFLNKLNGLQEVTMSIYQDLASCWWMILTGLAIAMITTLLWIVLMRFLASVVVWLSIIIVLVLKSVGIWYCYTRYEALKDVPESNVSWKDVGFTTKLGTYLSLKETWLAFIIILAILLAITLLVLIFLRNRIRISIALISYGSKAVGHIMSTLVFPIFPWIFQVLFIGYYVAVALYLASAGKSSFRVTGLTNQTDCTCPLFKDNFLCTPETFAQLCKCPNAACQFFAYDANSTNNYLQYYNLFGLLWSVCFISAVGKMILAGTFATWYWSFNKPRDVPFYAVSNSFYVTMRYHLGTAVFGSLIISVIRFIRIVLEYIDRKARQYQDNRCSRFILCCCKCFFWCLERFMRFVNRNAYIMCAIYGSNFCTSAKEAFSLLIRNVVRAGVLDTVTGLLLFLGRMVIVVALGILSYFVFSHQLNILNEYIPHLNFYLVPIIIIVLGTYFITGLFFGVYTMAIDTIFLCFLKDCEINDGSPEKPYFMSKELMAILKNSK